MFLGHFAVGFAAKRAAPQVSLGTLFLAAQFVDLLWPTFLLLGLERVVIDPAAPGASAVTPLVFEHYPLSHSLLATLFWGALLGAAHRALGGTARGALVLAALVASHWMLDALVHQPDLPVLPWGETRVGLGLWTSLPLTLAVEMPLFALGVLLYSRATQPRNGKGRWGFVGLVAFLLLVQVANLAGDPPPSVTAIAWVGQAQWLLVLWAYWVDRHRQPALSLAPKAAAAG